jgi:hypothetical protein
MNGGDKRSAYRLLMGNTEGNRLVERPRFKWMDNIKMDLGEIGRGAVDWIGMAQDRDNWRAFVNVVMSLRVP